MIVTKFESWWVERGKCLFDERRQGGAKMGWDVLVIKLTTDTGIEGVATCMAARSGAVSESYLQETIAPVVLGRDPMIGKQSFRRCGSLTGTRLSSRYFCPVRWT